MNAENKSSNFPYKVLDTSELPSVVKKIEKTKAQKFSTFVEQNYLFGKYNTPN